MPLPEPPSVKLGRMTTGKPAVPMSAAMRRCTSQASSIEWATPDLADSRPMSVMACLNFWRSSAFSMACSLAPISSTLCFFSTPWWARSSAQFSAVWPPMVGSSASGFSRSMIFSTACHVMGSI